MRGKVGFVLGAALGYVLGTRAGRARYEQIKRGAIAVWETPLVQQGVTTVKDSVDDRVQAAKAAASRAAKSAFVAATQPRAEAAAVKPAATKSATKPAATERSKGEQSETEQKQASAEETTA